MKKIWNRGQLIFEIESQFRSFLLHKPNRAVSSITSTVFFPIFPWIFQVAIIFFAIIVGLYLASVGVPINQVVNMQAEPSCQCVGLAASYTVNIERDSN